MKVTIDAKTMSEALKVARRVSVGATTLPILQCVLLTAEAGKLRITSSNCDAEAEAEASAEVIRPGQMAVPAKRLDAALATLEGEICVEMIEKQKSVSALISANGSRAVTLAAMPAEEFPPMHEAKGEKLTLTLPKGRLAEIMGALLRFVSADPTRYVINGVLVQIDGAGKANFVATDGKRLTVFRHELTGPAAEVILPTEFVKMAASIGDDETPTLRVDKERAELRGDGWRILTKVIEGVFPNWRQAVPAKSGQTVLVTYEREAMLEAMAVMAAVRGKDMKAAQVVTLIADKKGGELIVRAASAEIGEAEAVVVGAKVPGPIKIGFSGELFTDAVEVGPESQSLFLLDDQSPLLWAEATHDAVLMPCRIS